MKDGRKLYREYACVVEECFRTPTCFMHYPKHRGIGGRNAGWGLLEGAPGCDHHHRILDKQKPGDMTRERYEEERELIIACIWMFWARILQSPMREEYDLGPPERIDAVEAFFVREDPAYRRRSIGLVKFPPYSPKAWFVPDPVDYEWSFDDELGAATVEVDVVTEGPEEGEDETET